MKLNQKPVILNCIALLLCTAAAVLFFLQPGDYRHPALVLVASGCAAALNLVYCFYQDSYGILSTLSSAVNLGCLVTAIASQLNNIAMLMTGVGLGNSHVPFSFVLCAVFYLSAIVLNGCNVFAKHKS